MSHTADRPALIEFIRAGARDYSDRARKAGKFGQVPEPEPAKNLFTIHSARKWMELEKNTPRPNTLFGEFWYQGELCILFADTNAGKSILAVQIGNNLAGRLQMDPFGVEAPELSVVYVDFELTARQFQARYTHNEVGFDFNTGFYRAEYDPAADMPFDFKNYDEYVNSAIEYLVKAAKANVLIIDNITCLRSGTEYAANALPLMKHLKALKTKYQLSVLVLAHTPKRNPARPITRNDLQGSKMLINFCDSAFAIGQSQQATDLRYLKQVKQRTSREVYGEDHVCLFRIVKPLNFLKFEFAGYAQEREHLFRALSINREETIARVMALHAEGLSQRQISARLNISLATVNRMLKIEAE